jgi:hypothetical protein
LEKKSCETTRESWSLHKITPPAGWTTFERCLVVKRARSVSDMIGANFEHTSTDLGFHHQKQRG